ncbi:MAG: hotdog fold thioesterase [Firmicutes bacterium]|nr:hotdog fold thioesterase [Bacillota bacterium]
MDSRDVFSENLGIVIDREEPGTVDAHVHLTDNHRNQHGTAHGGVIFSLADAVFARASNSHGVPAVALDTSMTFIQAARPGDTLYAHCEEEALRHRVAVYTVRVTEENGRLIALFRGTVFRLGGQ